MSYSKKTRVIEYMDNIAEKRDKWIKGNHYYYSDLIKFLKNVIPEDSLIIEIGCGTGYILNSLKPRDGVGLDISSKMIQIAKSNYPHLSFYNMDVEDINIYKKFDYIIISDTIGYFEDVQKAFHELQKISHADTRIIITYHNSIWLPFFYFAELMRLKMPTIKLNWLNSEEVSNLLTLTGFDIIKMGRRFLIPKYFPIVSWVCNRIIGFLPLFNNLCITGYVIAKKNLSLPVGNESLNVSVIVPTRNEKGNIENIIVRMPRMGKNVEVIFVEGNSTDGTLEEIKRVCNKYSEEWDLKFCIQDGEGKGDAVRKGFDMASGDILMILDADLTVPPEDLPKFYDAIASGKGEFINGSRLVYPLEKEAMKTLNMVANQLFSVIFSWLLSQRIKDTLCGTKVISKKNYLKLIKNRNYFGDFDPFGDFDLIFGAAKLNLKMVEIPIRYRAREYGETNISRFKHGWLLLKMAIFAMNKIKFI